MTHYKNRINENCSLLARIQDGLELAVERSWTYRKRFDIVKPEYLVTVSVADEIMRGFGGNHPLNYELILEEGTGKITGGAQIAAKGLKKYFAEPIEFVSRSGKVDIFIKCEKSLYAVELKNFDPSITVIRKDIIRLKEMLALNDYKNSVTGGYLGMFFSIDRKNWLEKKLKEITKDSKVSFEIHPKSKLTGEDPEDGIPAYWTVVVELKKPMDIGFNLPGPFV